MEEDGRIYAAVALIAVIAVGSLFIGKGGGPTAASGPTWRSRLSAFGLAPSAGPSAAPEKEPASASPAPALSAPEPMMTKAATRLFSNPSGSGTGGLAGAEPAPAADASFAKPALNQGMGFNLPSGGQSPMSGLFGGAPGTAGTPPPGAGRGGGTSSGAGLAAGSGGGATAPGGGGTTAKGPGGDARAAGEAAKAFNGSTGSSLALKAGGGGPGFPGGMAGALSGDVKPSGGPPGGADAKAPELPGGIEGPKPGRSNGGDGGGGGGGSSGGKGMSGGPPAAQAVDAKASDAKGKEGGSSPGNSGRAPNSTAGAEPQASGEVSAPAAFIGTPQVGTTTIPGGMFKLRPNGPAEIPTVVRVTPTGARLVDFTAKLAIDADGAGGAWRGDRTGQPKTSLLYKDGSSLNPSQLPFVVVPVDFHQTHPNVKLGDYAAVTYGAKTVYAIIGDRGPAGVLGEGSISLAAGLGINPDPNKGGVSRADVRYLILPGSRDAEPPRDARTIQDRGRKLFEAAGVTVR